VGVRPPTRSTTSATRASLPKRIDGPKETRDLHTRDIPFDVVPGLDHDGMLRRLDTLLPVIAEWLSGSLRRR